MQTVFIPHPTEQLSLTSEQKCILQQLNSSVQDIHGCIMLPVYPLWCPVQNGTPASLRKSVNSFTIYAPVLTAEGFSFPCLYTADGVQLQSEIKAGIFNKNSTLKKDTQLLLQQLIAEHAQFRISCRVFMAGTAETQQNGWKVSNSFWIKTAEKKGPATSYSPTCVQ